MYGDSPFCDYLAYLKIMSHASLTRNYCDTYLKNSDK